MSIFSAWFSTIGQTSIFYNPPLSVRNTHLRLRYSIKILQSLIPALKPGARILINDRVLPEPNTSRPYWETLARQVAFMFIGGPIGLMISRTLY